MREEDAARTQDAEIFAERNGFLLAREHGQHCLVDHNVERRVGERKRERVALDNVDDVLKSVFFDICTRLLERLRIHIEPCDAAAVEFGERNHGRPHVAGNLEHARVGGKVHMTEQPLRRLASPRAQACLAKPREELMSGFGSFLFRHRYHSFYVNESCFHR